MNDFFNDDDFFSEDPQDNDITFTDPDEQGFLELVHQALESKHHDFTFIRS